MAPADLRFQPLLRRSLLAFGACVALAAFGYFFVDRPVAFFIHDRGINRSDFLKWETEPPPIIQAWAPVVLAALVVGWAVYQYEHGRGGFRLGVDLVGGSILVYEVDTSKQGGESVKSPRESSSSVANKSTRPSPIQMIWRHAVPNAIVPAIQVSALQLAYMAGGVVVVETVFGFPGIGSALVDAVGNRDIPEVQALTIIIAAVYVAVNLIADILTILVTPRLRTAAAR